jgi:hypothetical protein
MMRKSEGHQTDTEEMKYIYFEKLEMLLCEINHKLECPNSQHRERCYCSMKFVDLLLEYFTISNHLHRWKNLLDDSHIHCRNELREY